MDQIKSVDFKNKPFVLNGDDATYTCDSLIIATGISKICTESEKYLAKGGLQHVTDFL